jgi:CBS domain-containing protein
MRSMRSAKVAYDPGRPSRALTVREVMTTSVVTISSDDSVADAAAAMVRQKVGSALIMQSRFLAGILTERDVLRAAASGGDLMHSPVSAWMTNDPEQASPDTTVEDALQVMLLHGFRHLPVMEGREVRGVVSLRDLAAARITRPASRG